MVGASDGTWRLLHDVRNLLVTPYSIMLVAHTNTLHFTLLVNSFTFSSTVLTKKLRLARLSRPESKPGLLFAGVFSHPTPKGLHQARPLPLSSSAGLVK